MSDPLQIGPGAWSTRGFWERYFDGEADAVRSFEEEQAVILECDP